MNKEIVKIQVFCPEDFSDKVRLAIGKAGGGKSGNYSYCAFLTRGQGYFLPMAGARPAIGKVGKIEKVDEVKIEFVCEKDKINKIIKAIKKVHPYEEVPIDVISLINYK